MRTAAAMIFKKARLIMFSSKSAFVFNSLRKAVRPEEHVQARFVGSLTPVAQGRFQRFLHLAGKSIPAPRRLACPASWGHKYDGDTVCIGFQDELFNRGSGGRIEACGRLIQKQNIRFASERADGGKALLFRAA